VVVVDNSSVHHAKVVNAELPALAAAGVEFFFLPPYSPELNLIAVAWRHIKYEQLPERSYASADGLQAAVETAMTAYARSRAALRAS
jgi:transposase